ncbi:MAG: hypothetical protein IJ568_03905 [Bacilli bacterium]|nr:hypothetical protein [Bacilli bacterium]
MDYKELLKDGNIISYNGINDLILRVDKIDGKEIYSLYKKDGSLFLSNVNRNNILTSNGYGLPTISNSSNPSSKNKNESIETNNETVSTRKQEKTSKKHIIASGDSHGNRYDSNKKRTNTKPKKPPKDKNETKEISVTLGTLQDTKTTVANAKKTLSDAKLCEDGIVKSLDIVESAKSKGLGMKAALNFVSNLKDAMSTIVKNTEVTSEAAEEIDELNNKVKALEEKYSELDQRTSELKSLEDNKPEYTSWIDENKVRHDNQDEIDRYNAKHDRLIKEINRLNEQIDMLQQAIDYQYDQINMKYDNLLELKLKDSRFDVSSTMFKTDLSKYDPSSWNSNCLGPATGSIEYIKMNGIKYAMYTPEGYEGQNLPLILFLHGKGGGNSIKKESIFSLINEGKAPNAIVISPLMKAEDSYIQSPSILNSINSSVMEVAEEYGCDKQNINIIGYSNGASSAYRMIATHPNTYNKCISIAGDIRLHGLGTPENLSTTEIIEIHGDKDVSAYKYKETLDNINGYNKKYNTGITFITAKAGHGGDENIDETCLTTAFADPFQSGYDNTMVQQVSNTLQLTDEEQTTLNNYKNNTGGKEFYALSWLMTPKA